MLRYGLIIWFLSNIPLTHVKSQSDYWTMDGTIIKHNYYHISDSLSDPIIYELQGIDGLPMWFGRRIYKDVCDTGECKMIDLWLFWDGSGNYHGFQILEDEPLTKTDHAVFKDEDYLRLHELLADTNSVLRFLSQDELVVDTSTDIRGTVDAYTSATQPSLAQVVVKDAVYTCYTLWHMVYGHLREEILRILNSRLSTEYLKRMLNSKKKEHQIWAIQSVSKNPHYQEAFNKSIINLITSDDTHVSNVAIQYIQSLGQLDSALQVELVNVMSDVDLNTKHRILRLIIQLRDVEDKVLMNILDQVANQNIYTYEYNSIIKLIKPHHLHQGNPIYEYLEILSQHKNPIISDLTRKYLASIR